MHARSLAWHQQGLYLSQSEPSPLAWRDQHTVLGLAFTRSASLSHHRHPRCGTEISPDRDIALHWRNITAPRRSLSTVPPVPSRTPAGKAQLFEWAGEIRRDTDCLLERNGFELPVPRENGYRSESSGFVYLPETVRVSSKDLPTPGTEVSNPLPSSEESANFRSLSGGRIGVRIAARMRPPLHSRGRIPPLVRRLGSEDPERRAPVSGSSDTLVKVLMRNLGARKSLRWRVIGLRARTPSQRA